MGREALTWAEVGGEAGDVRALLESTELILRGGVRRRFPRDKLAQVRVEGDLLRFNCCGEAVALQLGATVADRWAKAIDTPPPGLRAKLGLAAGARALRVGAFDDAALESALAGMLVDAVDGTEAVRLSGVIEANWQCWLGERFEPSASCPAVIRSRVSGVE